MLKSSLRVIFAWRVYVWITANQFTLKTLMFQIKLK